ncbi:MAG: hypothetical protein MUC87_03050 [Bacteroidia bacterium]|jgi:hypothetical protein|nr:hypothetical protein [Bacteroidia bacterium]
MQHTLRLAFACALFVGFTSCSENEGKPAAKTDSVAAPATENKPQPDQAATATKAEFTCNLGGSPWRGAGFFNSHLYYAGGNSMFKKPYPHAMITFRSITANDTRQLNIMINNFDGKTGVIPAKNLEILLSGSPDGDNKNSVMLGNGRKDAPSPFTVEITKWESKEANKAIASGKVSGKLTGYLGDKSSSEITDGVFTDIEVQVFTEKY